MKTCTWTDTAHAKARQLLQEVANLRTPDGRPWGIAHRAAELLPDLADRPRALPGLPSSSARRRGESVSAMRRRIRAEVKARAKGRCEFRDPSTGERCPGSAIVWDHFWGRGRDESAEGSWMLCVTHDRAKGRAEGGRCLFIMAFRAHCLASTFSAQVERCDGAAALERAQHPEHEEEAAHG